MRKGRMVSGLRTSMMRAVLLVLACAATPLVAAEHEKGKEINGTCSACHGGLGQGGKKGEYPRLAGQRAAYIEDQLKSFRARTRINIPMFPYTQERELPDEDIKEIAAYLSSIELPNKMPTFAGNEGALAMLEMVDKVMIVPRVEGDIENGKAIFQKSCYACHGKTGRGRGKFPMLVGQYSNYLKRQMDLYLKGDRPHDEDGVVGILNTLKPGDLQDILAYLTTLQEPTE
jgi:cytochrome c553